MQLSQKGTWKRGISEEKQLKSKALTVKT